MQRGEYNSDFCCALSRSCACAFVSVCWCMCFLHLSLSRPSRALSVRLCFSFSLPVFALSRSRSFWLCCSRSLQELVGSETPRAHARRRLATLRRGQREWSLPRKWWCCCRLAEPHRCQVLLETLIRNPFQHISTPAYGAHKGTRHATWYMTRTQGAHERSAYKAHTHTHRGIHARARTHTQTHTHTHTLHLSHAHTRHTCKAHASPS
jgi:hypothetical protein